MSEENKENNAEQKAQALAEQLGVKFEELNPAGHDVLKQVAEKEKGDDFAATLQGVPDKTVKKLLESGMGSYVLEARETELVSSEQGAVLVAVLEENGFKFQPVQGGDFSSNPPKLEDVKGKENAAEVFQNYLCSELQQKAEQTLPANASEEDKNKIAAIYDKAPLAALLVGNNKVATSLEQVLENIQHKVLGEEIAKATEAAGKLEGDEKTAALEVIEKKQDLLAVVRQDVVEHEHPLKDEKRNISGGLKEMLDKVWKLEPEKLKTVHEAVKAEQDKGKEGDVLKVFHTQLEAQGVKAEEELKNTAQRNVAKEEEKKPFWKNMKVMGVLGAAALVGALIVAALRNKEPKEPQVAAAGGHGR